MARLRYRRYSGKKKELAALVDCYGRVFATEPWNEWKRCAVCDTKWGIKQRGELDAIGFEHCGQPVQDFWPAETVVTDLKHEVTAEASCWLAWNRRSVVAFCWGYPITPEALAEKLSLPDLATAIKSEFGDHALIAYQDELGVDEPYRGRKIAHELFDLRLKDFRKAGLKVGIIRTMTNPPTVTYAWFTQIGYRTIAAYGDVDGRVVLGRDLAGIRAQRRGWWGRLVGRRI